MKAFAPPKYYSDFFCEFQYSDDFIADSNYNLIEILHTVRAMRDTKVAGKQTHIRLVRSLWLL